VSADAASAPPPGSLRKDLIFDPTTGKVVAVVESRVPDPEAERKAAEAAEREKAEREAPRLEREAREKRAAEERAIREIARVMPYVFDARQDPEIRRLNALLAGIDGPGSPTSLSEREADAVDAFIEEDRAERAREAAAAERAKQPVPRAALQPAP
jgi:hypothetical protein